MPKKVIQQRPWWHWLVMILAFATITRFWRLDFTQAYLFDEVYHAVTVKLMARNDPRAFEWWNPPIEPNTAVDWLHPPFAKYTQALGVLLFGENAFGWRVSAAVFGVLLIWATAKFAHVLFEDSRVALLAALLATLDGLLLVQSRIAMNDIHVTFFIILTFMAFWLYRLRKIPLALVGVAAGFAIGSKWSGFFALLLIVAWYGVEALMAFAKTKAWKTFGGSILQGVLFLVLIPATLYLFAYSEMFWQGKSLVCEGQSVQQGQCYCRDNHSWWVNTIEKYIPSQTALAQFVLPALPKADPVRTVTTWADLERRGGCERLVSHFNELHHQIWWYQTNLKATHGYQSRPMEWFLDARPVWMYVDYGQGFIANVYAQGNFALFWIGDLAVLITIGVVFWELSKKPRAFAMTLPPTALRLFYLLCCYLIVWAPWEFSPRIMFFYHYTPAVPLLCIILAYWLGKAWQTAKTTMQRAMVVSVVAVIAFIFVVFYPNWTGIPVPTWWAERVYFALPNWR